MVNQSIGILCNMPTQQDHHCWNPAHDGDLYLSILWSNALLEFWLTPSQFADLVTARSVECTDMHRNLSWELGMYRVSSNTDRDGMFNLRVRSKHTLSTVIDVYLAMQQFVCFCVGVSFGCDGLAESDLARVFGTIDTKEIEFPEFSKPPSGFPTGHPEAEALMAEGYGLCAFTHTQRRHYATFRKYTL